MIIILLYGRRHVLTVICTPLECSEPPGFQSCSPPETASWRSCLRQSSVHCTSCLRPAVPGRSCWVEGPGHSRWCWYRWVTRYTGRGQTHWTMRSVHWVGSLNNTQESSTTEQLQQNTVNQLSLFICKKWYDRSISAIKYGNLFCFISPNKFALWPFYEMINILMIIHLHHIPGLAIEDFYSKRIIYHLMAYYMLTNLLFRFLGFVSYNWSTWRPRHCTGHCSRSRVVLAGTGAETDPTSDCLPRSCPRAQCRAHPVQTTSVWCWILIM